MRRLKKSLRVFALATLASAFVIASPAMAGPSGGLSVIADLNGDQIADMTILNADAKTYGYLFDGSLGVESQGLIKKIPNGFSAIQVCDINGDLNSDLLFQDSSRKVRAYLLDGTSVSDEGLIKQIANGYTVAGCADINGDGKADILAYNASTRVAYV